MTIISAAMIYKLLKQFYCDAGCFPNSLTQSIYESVFQSVPRFSHVPQIARWHYFIDMGLPLLGCTASIIISSICDLVLSYPNVRICTSSYMLWL